MNVKLKLMPESPDSDLKAIEEKAKKIIEKKGGKGVHFEEEPIAFGLKAVIVMFEWPEEKELEEIENQLGNIDGVSSEEMIDLRRAIG